MTEPRLKIAVFIDFDNIEIGVKTTLNQTFDVSVILEAIKERGEVVTKVAYGDWKRAGDHGRQLSQHAIRLVQRNLTPGGDKNGADINLALDALEMAFTHHHINAFVIVGGDSDFITLVEKLKQYDKKVFVVGGRQFTSMVMQRNCHEFVAYENLVRSGRGPSERRSGAGGSADIARALPLVKRALKVLVDREVTPQLGLLKSTLLQLDSTFSEREYGVSTFRDFIEKVAQTGIITLRHAGRSLLVDLADGNGAGAEPSAAAERQPAERQAPPAAEGAEPASAAPTAPPAAPPPDPAQAQQAVEYARGLFARAAQPPRWPMYVRQVKQYFRGVDESFDERRLGFASIVDFLRACQRENVIRLERDRQGGLRVFPGAALTRPAAAGDGPASSEYVGQGFSPAEEEEDASTARVGVGQGFSPAEGEEEDASSARVGQGFSPAEGEEEDASSAHGGQGFSPAEDSPEYVGHDFSPAGHEDAAQPQRDANAAPRRGRSRKTAAAPRARKSATKRAGAVSRGRKKSGPEPG